MTRFARFALMVFVFSALLVASAVPVFAGSASVSGTFPAGGSPKMPVVTISPPNCASQGSTQVQYDAWAFTVDAPGTYTFTQTSPAAPGRRISLYLHSAGFNPAAGRPTCLAADNTVPITFSFALSAGVTYYAVPFDDTFTQAGGSYTLTISGPGNVYFAGEGPGSGNSIEDGRLNKYDLAAPLAIYCSDDSFEVWAIDGAGQGTLAFTADSAALTAADASAANAVFAEGLGIRAFKLTSGEVQVVSAPDFEGKVYNVLFNAFPCGLVDTWLNE